MNDQQRLLGIADLQSQLAASGLSVVDPAKFQRDLVRTGPPDTSVIHLCGRFDCRILSPLRAFVRLVLGDPRLAPVGCTLSLLRSSVDQASRAEIQNS